MLKPMRLAMLMTMLFAVALAGCANETAVSPPASAPVVGTDLPSAEEFAAMSEEEMFATLRAMVGDSDGSPLVGAEPGEFKLPYEGLGVEMGSPQTKVTPLPMGLEVVVAAAHAINAVNHRQEIHPTDFVEEDGVHWGFQVTWREYHLPDEHGETESIHLIADFDADTPLVHPQFVAPTTKPIYDSAVRVYFALADPKSCVNRYYSVNEEHGWERFVFDYPTPDGMRKYDLTRLGSTGAPVPQ